MVYAHRLVYEECFGPIPAGMVIMHTCDNKICVNPEHLKVGTREENSHDEAVRIGVRGRKFKGLTPREVREIRSSDTINTDTAHRFGVSLALVTMVRNRKRWASVA